MQMLRLTNQGRHFRLPLYWQTLWLVFGWRLISQLILGKATPLYWANSLAYFWLAPNFATNIGKVRLANKK